MEIINNPDQQDLELVLMVVNFGLGSKAIKIAKKNGVYGGTIFLGKGTTKNRLLELLELNDSRKEIVLMIADKTTAYLALEVLSKELAFHKPNHGIAFTISVACMLGSKKCQLQNSKKNRGETTMYQAIFTIVDRGCAEDVIEAGKKGGARGGTIIHARGSGIHETNTLFAMAIEPEKEMVMIICKTDQTDSIMSSIKEHVHLDEPGKGISFILNVNKTYGLY